MPVYDCPECGAPVKVPDAAAGKKVRCPDCKTAFAPPAGAARPEKATAKAAPKAAARPPEPTKKKPADDDDDVSPFGLVKESEEEEKLARKNKPTFGAVKDKYKRSARGRWCSPTPRRRTRRWSRA